ncbi:hypothetical protein D3C85_1245940 [compost metagenome]
MRGEVSILSSLDVMAAKFFRAMLQRTWIVVGGAMGAGGNVEVQDKRGVVTSCFAIGF